jgi:hypothetical protein
VIIGFIAGSLGVVWPWKEKVMALTANGKTELDANGREIIIDYNRFFPSEFSVETMLAILFMFVGITIVLSLDWYQKYTNSHHG